MTIRANNRRKPNNINSFATFSKLRLLNCRHFIPWRDIVHYVQRINDFDLKFRRPSRLHAILFHGYVDVEVRDYCTVCTAIQRVSISAVHQSIRWIEANLLIHNLEVIQLLWVESLNFHDVRYRLQGLTSDWIFLHPYCHSGCSTRLDFDIGNAASTVKTNTKCDLRVDNFVWCEWLSVEIRRRPLARVCKQWINKTRASPFFSNTNTLKGLRVRAYHGENRILTMYLVNSTSQQRTRSKSSSFTKLTLRSDGNN